MNGFLDDQSYSVVYIDLGFNFPSGNGTVEFAEFENFMLTSGVLNKIPDEMDENLRDAFKILDKNNDGYIDKEELIFYMTKFGQQLVF